MVLKKLALPLAQYFPTAQIKTQIVLHHTGGPTANSAFEWWKTDPERVGTAFLIDRDPAATVYTVFDPAHWAWHLGVGKLFGTKADQQSIGIEIVNVGPLTPVQIKPTAETLRKNPDAKPVTEYRWWTNQAIPLADVTIPAKVWRGVQAHQTYTDAQVKACAELVNQLATAFKIPKTFLPEAELFETVPSKAFQHHGILTHVNYSTQKNDLPPSFPWARFRSLLV